VCGNWLLLLLVKSGGHWLSAATAGGHLLDHFLVGFCYK